jgi:hypothetical protein
MTEQRAPTHADLVERAMRWLANTRRCEAVVREPSRWNSSQSPDAIGWQGTGWSVAVECKTSVSDFYAQGSKAYVKNGELPFGQERWLLVPKGLIRPDVFRSKRSHGVWEGWGLMETRKSRIYRLVEPESAWNPERFRVEAPFLVQLARSSDAVETERKMREYMREAQSQRRALQDKNRELQLLRSWLRKHAPDALRHVDEWMEGQL